MEILVEKAHLVRDFLRFKELQMKFKLKENIWVIEDSHKKEGFRAQL